MYLPIYTEMKQKAEVERRESIVRSFSIERLDGVDYIRHNGVIVSRSVDGDLLDRIDELRRIAIREAGL